MTTPTDLEILILWRRGMDTYDIAKQFMVPEHLIANRLPRIRSSREKMEKLYRERKVR